MPPHKPVKSLFALALDATSKSVLSACKNLDVKFPCASDSIDAFSADGCRAAIQELQDYLLAAPRVWDSLFNSVMDLHQPSHIGLHVEMFILATFIYNKVVLTKLQIRYSLLDVENIHTRRYFEFWMEQAPKLENLFELDLGKVGPKCEDVVYAFGRSCKHLKILKLQWKVSEAAAVFMFASCKELQALYGSFDNDFTKKRALELCKNLEYCFEFDSRSLLEFDRNHRFKLKSITLEGSPQQVKEYLENCPELQEIHLYYTKSELLDVVAGSEVKLLKLTLNCYNIEFDALDRLLTSKGDLLTELTIYCCEMSWQLQMMQLIGENCPNLTFLDLEDVYNWSMHPDLPGTVTSMSYPNLQNLVITVCGDVSGFSPSCLYFINQCIASAKSLLSFTVYVFKDYDEPLESDDCFLDNWFIELFSNNHGVTHLKKVILKNNSDDWSFFSKQLTELIIKRCPKLTELHIDNITVEAASYLDGLREESQVKNLDIVIGYSLHGQE